MEDVTDSPFRTLCKRLGADVVYTEFVKSEELARGVGQARRKLAFRDEERPLGVQLYGGDPDIMTTAAQCAEELAPDLIDLNCGCWVKDVTRHGAGASLLLDLPRLERLVQSVVRAVRLPVTLKTRLGWDRSNIRILDVARLCEANGIHALTVHCRTRDQGHAGAVDYSWIPRLKAAVSIPVIVNGDVQSPRDVERLFDDTGCDGVMIGRAAIRNPWIFRAARHLLRTGEVPPPPSPAERLELFRSHVRLSIDHLGEEDAIQELRRHYAVVLHGMPHVGAVRDELRRARSATALLEHLSRFDELYAPSGPNAPSPTNALSTPNALTTPTVPTAPTTPTAPSP